MRITTVPVSYAQQEADARFAGVRWWSAERPWVTAVVEPNSGLPFVRAACAASTWSVSSAVPVG